jgi:preprotein translocase subunit YajC
LNSSFLMIVLYAAAFIGIFYFMLIRPQQRQRRAHDALVSSIKPGDKIVTAGGIFGTVKRTQEDTVVLTIAKGVDITVARRAIGEVVQAGKEKRSIPAETVEPEAIEEEDQPEAIEEEDQPEAIEEEDQPEA